MDLLFKWRCYDAGRIGGVIMTPAQVSALSDTELNRAMIWLYPLQGTMWMADQTGCHMIERRWQVYTVDHLSDWNLTMPLAVANHLFTESPHSMNLKGFAGTMTGDTTAHCTTLLRAICEVLVLIALERPKINT